MTSIHDAPILKAQKPDDLGLIFREHGWKNSGWHDPATVSHMLDEKKWLDTNTLKRFGTPEKLADTAIHILSDESLAPKDRGKLNTLLSAIMEMKRGKIGSEVPSEKMGTISALYHEQRDVLIPDALQSKTNLRQAEQPTIDFGMAYLENNPHDKALNRTLATQALERLEIRVKEHQKLIKEQDLLGAKAVESEIVPKINFIGSLLEKTRDTPAMTQSELHKVLDACCEANRSEMQEGFMRSAERAPQQLENLAVSMASRIQKNIRAL